METSGASALSPDIAAAVRKTPFIDTHEHLVEEERRTQWRPGGHLPCDDWAVLFSHYLDSDLLVAGMPQRDYERFVAPDVSPTARWALLEPWWPAVRSTGYGQAVRIAVERLYGVRQLDARSVERVATRYRETVKPGFYHHVLRDVAGIESCQVNSLETTFSETSQPDLLMQDISILDLGSVTGRAWEAKARRARISVRGLADYHRVLDWWFERYGPYAVAVKSQAAYGRRLDFEDVSAERADEPFRRLVNGAPLTGEEQKAIDDHLFWECVRRATAHGLPVKLHTGYYAGHNGMPLSRVATNPGDVCELLRRAPDTTFVLMHIGYPYQEQMISIAKHWRNAVIDMCWAWIINPAAAQRFLADFLMAAPANKVLTFGGDYIPVEPVVGHAAIARRGLAGALCGLVEDGWLNSAEAVDLVGPLMNGNARSIFRLAEKEMRLRSVPWLKPAPAEPGGATGRAASSTR